VKPVTNEWKELTDEKLAKIAQDGLQGQGAPVEAMRRNRKLECQQRQLRSPDVVVDHRRRRSHARSSDCRSSDN
jgi:hypothetical protein